MSNLFHKLAHKLHINWGHTVEIEIDGRTVHGFECAKCGKITDCIYVEGGTFLPKDRLEGKTISEIYEQEYSDPTQPTD